MLGLDKTEINKRLKKSLDGSTPQLICIVTGKSRITNQDFLKTKIFKFGSIDNYMANYICREVLSLFKEGKRLHEVNANAKITEDNLKSALLYYDVDYK